MLEASTWSTWSAEKKKKKKKKQQSQPQPSQPSQPPPQQQQQWHRDEPNNTATAAHAVNPHPHPDPNPDGLPKKVAMERLLSMGFARDPCQHALSVCKGDVAAAIHLLCGPLADRKGTQAHTQAAAATATATATATGTAASPASMSASGALALSASSASSARSHEKPDSQPIHRPPTAAVAVAEPGDSAAAARRSWEELERKERQRCINRAWNAKVHCNASLATRPYSNIPAPPTTSPTHRPLKC